MTGVPPARRPTTTVFQDYALFPHMTLTDNVGFGLRMRGVDRGRAPRQGRGDAGARRPAGRGRPAARTRFPAGSGSGWRSPARSPSDPDVLLLDEPLGALDLKLRRADAGRAEGDPAPASARPSCTSPTTRRRRWRIADRIVVMNAGPHRGSRAARAGLPPAAHAVLGRASWARSTCCRPPCATARGDRCARRRLRRARVAAGRLGRRGRRAGGDAPDPARALPRGGRGRGGARGGAGRRTSPSSAPIARPRPPRRRRGSSRICRRLRPRAGRRRAPERRSGRGSPPCPRGLARDALPRPARGLVPAAPGRRRRHLHRRAPHPGVLPLQHLACARPRPRHAGRQRHGRGLAARMGAARHRAPAGRGGEPHPFRPYRLPPRVPTAPVHAAEADLLAAPDPGQHPGRPLRDRRDLPPPAARALRLRAPTR